MQDVKLKADEIGIFDLVIENGRIASVDGMETTILVSLFTDARAPASIVPDAKNRRGWVGDILRAQNAEYTGGHLWLLEQARMNNNTFLKAEIYASNSLKPLLTKKIATSINIRVVPQKKRIDIETEIVINENTIERYSTLWRKTNASGLSNI